MESQNKFDLKLTDVDWVKDLVFLVDIITYLNILNLQEKIKLSQIYTIQFSYIQIGNNDGKKYISHT